MAADCLCVGVVDSQKMSNYNESYHILDGWSAVMTRRTEYPGKGEPCGGFRVGERQAPQGQILLSFEDGV